MPPTILLPPRPPAPGPGMEGRTKSGRASSASSDVPMSANTSVRTSDFFGGSAEVEQTPLSLSLSLSLPFPTDDRPTLSFLSGTERRGARRAEQSGARARKRARRTHSRRWSRTLSMYTCASVEVNVVVCRR